MRILTIADQIAELEATRRDLQGMLPRVQGAGHARLLRRIAAIDDSLAKLKEPPQAEPIAEPLIPKEPPNATP